jgi:hypothetical protein
MESELVESVPYEGGPVDVEVVMDQIRDYLAKKHGGTRARSPVETSSSRIFAPETYDELYEANQTYDKLYVAPYLTPVKIPLFGALWQKLRGALHSLAIFYVNRLAEVQMRFNGHTVRVLNEIVRGLDGDQTPNRVTELERRVEVLEKHVRALAERTDTATTGAPEDS